MGFYIDPEPNDNENYEQAKTRFLKECGLEVGIKDLQHGDYWVPVVRVHNGGFTAVGIAYNKQELKEFIDPRDTRPKEYWMVKKEEIVKIHPKFKDILILEEDDV